MSRVLVALVLLLASAAPAAAQVERSPDVTYASVFDPGVLLSVGWLDREREHRDAARVLASAHEGAIEERSLTKFDRLFVPREIDGRALQRGDRVQLFRADRPVVDPETDEPVGELVLATGVAEVDSLAGEVARAVVREAFRPVLVGDRVRRLPATATAPTSTPADAEGYVVAFETPSTLQPPLSVLFLRTTRGALAPGDVVELYRPGEERNGRRLADARLGLAVAVRLDGGIVAAVLSDLYRADLAPGVRFREVAPGAP